MKRSELKQIIREVIEEAVRYNDYGQKDDAGKYDRRGRIITEPKVKEYKPGLVSNLSSAISNIIPDFEGNLAEMMWMNLFAGTSWESKMFDENPNRLARIMKRFFSKSMPGDKPSVAAMKQFKIDAFGPDAIKDISKYNPKFAGSLSKDPVIAETIAENKRESIKDQINKFRGNEAEESAIRQFFNKYSSDLDVYDIYHTYVDLEPLPVEKQPKENISMMNRTSAFTTKYIGTVSSGPYSMLFSETNPISVTSVNRI